jgi:hypothetical protein
MKQHIEIYRKKWVAVGGHILDKRFRNVRYRKRRLTAVRIRCADHAISSIRKSWH